MKKNTYKLAQSFFMFSNIMNKYFVSIFILLLSTLFYGCSSENPDNLPDDEEYLTTLSTSEFKAVLLSLSRSEFNTRSYFDEEDDVLKERISNIIQPLITDGKNIRKTLADEGYISKKEWKEFEKMTDAQLALTSFLINSWKLESGHYSTRKGIVDCGWNAFVGASFDASIWKAAGKMAAKMALKAFFTAELGVVGAAITIVQFTDCMGYTDIL